MSNLLFDLSKHSGLAKATKASVNRRSGTVAETVRHSLVHTASPNATLHHCVIGACPHPVRERADMGDHYMVGYVSIPMAWAPLLTSPFSRDYDVSFIGPAGTIQRLPSAMYDCEDVLGDRLYLGFDWLDFAQSTPPVQQPSYERIKDRIVDCMFAFRERFSV